MRKQLRTAQLALGEALEQQTATAEILKVISASPTDTQPVFDTIAERAVKLCDAEISVVSRFDGELIHLVASHGVNAEATQAMLQLQLFPMRPSAETVMARTVRARGVVHIPDVLADPLYAAKGLAAAAHYRSSLGVPMMREGQVEGGIFVARSKAGLFSDKQVEVLKTFADQAVIAIENARLFNETKEALKRQTATSDVLSAISGAQTDVAPVFEAIARNAQRLCGAVVCNVLRYDGEMLHIAASHGFPPEQEKKLREKYPVKAGDASVLSGRVIVSRRMEHIEDVQADPAYDHAHAANVAGWRRMLGVPMLRDDVPLGVIVVAWRDPGKTPESEVGLLKTFAAQAAIAIENVRLFNETKEALEQQTATSEILGVISSSPTDLGPVFDAILKSALRLCEAHLGHLSLYDGESYRTVAQRGATAEFAKYISERGAYKPEGPALARATAERRPVHIRDMREEPAYLSRKPNTVKFVEMGGARTFLDVPLVKEDKVLGVLVIYRPEVRPFTEKQIALVSLFANQAVIAMENVRLFKELEARNSDLGESLEQQTATADILKVISSSTTDTQPVFEAIVQSAARLFEPCNAIINIREGEVLLRKARAGPRDTVDLDQLNRTNPISLKPGESVSARAINERRVIEVPDIEALDETEMARSTARRANYRSAIVVPLIREKEAIGALALTHREPGYRLGSKKIALLRTFADQAVIAIENARLFNDTKEGLERQTATADILKVISASPTDVQPVFDAIASSAVRLCGGLYGAVYRFDGKLVHFVAHHGWSREALELHSGQYPVPPRGLTGRALLERTVMHAPDVMNDKRSVNPQLAATLGYRSFLGVPMLRDGEPIGVIAVFRAQLGPFSDAHISVLRTFADQAVIAVENVRLFNETKEALEQQTATAEILKVISSSPTDVQPVFDAIASNAARLCEADNVGVFRVEGDQLRMAAYFGDVPHARNVGDVFALTRGSVTGRAVLDRRTIHVHDLAAEPDEEWPEAKWVQRTIGYRTALAIPLMREGVAIGSIFTRRTEIRPFSDKHIALLQTFADQAVIAIENVRLFNETKESLERQTATSEILRVISSSPADLQPVFDTIARNFIVLCGAAFGTVYTYDGKLVHLAGGAGLPPEQDRAHRAKYPVRVDDPSVISARTILAGAPVHVPDALADPHYDHERARHLGVRRILGVPMLREGESLGALVAGWYEPGATPNQHEELLKTFADQAVIAIENVRLFNETKEALEQQTATSEILGVISRSPTNLAPVFDAILKSALELCEAHLGHLNLFDGEHHRTVAHRGANPEYAKYLSERGPYKPGHSLTRIAAERRPLQVPDLRQAPGYLERKAETVKLVELEGARTSLYVPLLKEDKTVGAIIIYRPEVRPFTEKQVALVSLFANQAVIAIENARLFKALEERTEALTKSVRQLTALGEVGQAITSTLDLETVLKTIVQRAVQLTGLDGGSVYEYDERTEEFRLQAAENMNEELVEAVRRTPVKKGDGAIGRSAVSLDPVQVADILDDEYQSARREVLIRAGYRAVLAVPLLREDHMLGAILVHRRSPGPFAPEIVELLKTFATQSAMAIQNARLFREIAEKSRQLEVASQHKSQFLASMSHELRTPLNAILGFNEMVIDEIYGPVPEGMKSPLENIQSSGKHLLRLINNVLDLAKIEAGRMELALSDYSVQDMVSGVHSTLRPLAAEKGLDFVAEVSPDIPTAHGDAGRLAQCLMNLAGNSLKFTRQGRVAIAVAQRDGLLRFSVADTGIGIPPEKIASLFTEFKQTDATIASEYGGTGLGLSITKKFIEMHGGRIWVESEPGKGSNFLFEIPLRVGR